MIFQVQFKTPDSMKDAIEYALHEKYGIHQMDDCDCSDDYHAAMDVNEKFVKYGELITVEFDTKKQTAIVVRI